MTTEQVVLGALSGLLTIVTGGAAAWMRAVGQRLDEMTEHGSETRETLAVIRTTLIGANGDNGINSEVRALRSRVHDLGDKVQSVINRQDVLAVRIDRMEDERS